MLPTPRGFGLGFTDANPSGVPPGGPALHMHAITVVWMRRDPSTGEADFGLLLTNGEWTLPQFSVASSQQSCLGEAQWMACQTMGIPSDRCVHPCALCRMPSQTDDTITAWVLVLEIQVCASWAMPLAWCTRAEVVGFRPHEKRIARSLRAAGIETERHVWGIPVASWVPEVARVGMPAPRANEPQSVILYHGTRADAAIGADGILAAGLRPGTSHNMLGAGVYLGTFAKALSHAEGAVVRVRLNLSEARLQLGFPTRWRCECRLCWRRAGPLAQYVDHRGIWAEFTDVFVVQPCIASSQGEVVVSPHRVHLVQVLGCLFRHGDRLVETEEGVWMPWATDGARIMTTATPVRHLPTSKRSHRASTSNQVHEEWRTSS